MPAYVHPTYSLVGQIPTVTAAYEEACVDGLHLKLRPSFVCGTYVKAILGLSQE